MVLKESELYEFVLGDSWMMQVLRSAEEINLPDWWIGAGFLRNAVWDHLSGVAPRHDADVDLVYFDAGDPAPERDWELEQQVQTRFPFAQWEIRNQARMHKVDGATPYSSTAEGISHWVETATCVAVRLRREKLEFLFCYGSQDLLGMIASPIPSLLNAEGWLLFESRVEKKKWRERWPTLRIADRFPTKP